MWDGKLVMVNTQVNVAEDQAISPKSRDVALDRVRYRAVWRSRYLIILPIDCHPFRRSVSAVMEGDRDRLLACLKHSPVKRLLLSPELKCSELYFWAELGRHSNRPVYLRSSKLARSTQDLSRYGLTRILNFTLALMLLLMFSPVMLGLSLFELMTQGEIFERSWQVGYRGKLFLGLRFVGFGPFASIENEGNAGVPHAWLRQLPQLFNILRGDTGFNRQFIGLNALERDEVLLDS
jgi:hypothetical protein